MDLRRAISLLSVSVVATGSVVVAAPKKGDAPKATPAAAKGSGSGSGSGSSAAASDPLASPGGSAGGSAVQMTEDAPPSDMNGTDENPDAPRDTLGTPKVTAAVAAPVKKGNYPDEEVLRPITLPQNMSEVSIAPHIQVGGSGIPLESSDALRARYGITDKIQLGFTYVFAGIYGDVSGDPTMNYALHSGKALGFDVTYLLQSWVGVRVGVPVYLSPLAVSLAIGAPIKFSFGDKFAIGGLDDLLNIKLDRFAPSFYQEFDNALAASQTSSGGNNTVQPNGHIRVSAYGEYQSKPNVAWIGRLGVDNTLGSGGGSVAGTTMTGGTATFIRAGVQWTPKHYLDVGGSLGFDDLAHLGTFTPQAYLALRI